jgi:hypothetical protein
MHRQALIYDEILPIKRYESAFGFAMAQLHGNTARPFSMLWRPMCALLT